MSNSEDWGSERIYYQQHLVSWGLSSFTQNTQRRGWGGPAGVLSGQTLHLLRVPPIGALTFYFPSLRSIVKSLRANHCPLNVWHLSWRWLNAVMFLWFLSLILFYLLEMFWLDYECVWNVAKYRDYLLQHQFYWQDEVLDKQNVLSQHLIWTDLCFERDL